ncbi:MAG: type II secretion system major pseudopilin GspG [Candidatus Binatia bacterium]
MNRPLRTTASGGFTLVEILIVVFIIGLLATIVSVNVIGRTDEARRTKAMADIKEIEQGVHLFKLDNGFYPTTDQGIAALIQKPTSGPPARKYPADGYLNKSSVPEDPWGYPYVYLSDGQSYILRSLGGDGEQGGEGNAADLDSRDLG